MSFRPNTTAQLYRKRAKRDIHGRESFEPPVFVGVSVVQLRDQVEETSVRADSSASRGAGDQETLQAKVLIGYQVAIAKGDVLKVHGRMVEIESIHLRLDVVGRRHHQELGGNIKGDM